MEKYKSYQCQTCGDNIGLLERFNEWVYDLFGIKNIIHDCKYDWRFYPDHKPLESKLYFCIITKKGTYAYSHDTLTYYPREERWGSNKNHNMEESKVVCWSEIKPLPFI